MSFAKWFYLENFPVHWISNRWWKANWIITDKIRTERNSILKLNNRKHEKRWVNRSVEAFVVDCFRLDGVLLLEHISRHVSTIEHIHFDAVNSHALSLFDWRQPSVRASIHLDCFIQRIWISNMCLLLSVIQTSFRYMHQNEKDNVCLRFENVVWTELLLPISWFRFFIRYLYE